MAVKISRIGFIFILLLNCYSSFAGGVKGKVIDSKTHEPLVGATVQLQNGSSKYTAAVNLDGSYNFKNIPAGKYSLDINFVGYEHSQSQTITVKSDNDVVAVNNIELKEENTELSEVKVSSKTKASDEYVRKLEKNADMVVNIMSQKSIELSPDVTVANSLQRMSGVTVQRSSNGEGRYAIIRGMDQRYNNTLVNGIKIPSPDDKFRFVPMDLFPSDLLERLEVIKALTPTMEADAVGGTMNMVMKNAPNKKTINGFINVGTNVLFNDRPFYTFDRTVINKQDPAAINGNSYIATDKDFPRANLDIVKKPDPINFQTGLTYGDRFFKKKLGFIIGLSFQNNYRGSNSIYNQQAAQPTYLRNLNGIPGNNYDNYSKFSDATIREYSTQNRRIAINNKFDYVFNKNNKISLFNLYVKLDEFQARYIVDTNVATNPGQLQYLTRTRWQAQSIYNSTLQGNHTLSDKLSFNWSAVYSLAKQEVPDMAQFQVENFYSNGVLTKGTGLLKGMDRTWSHNTDKDLTGYLNVIYNADVFSKKVEFTVGGMFRHKDRDNYYNDYHLSAKGSSQAYTNIYNAVYEFNPAGAGAANLVTGNTYTITEEIGAGYAQFKFMATDKLQLLGGVRIENTNQKYNTVAPVEYNLKYGTIKYTDVLPSLHAKYELTKNQNLRASYFRSISRPAFYEIVPFYIAETDDGYARQGNPLLKHSIADNFDVRYELFPNATADQILIGAFYKVIHNPIELGLATNKITGGNSGTSTQILTPLNYGDAHNYGFELVYTKYFGKFGVAANYTYTHSSITTPKNYIYYDTTKNPPQSNTASVNQTRPMQGQADHIANVSALFKDSKFGLDMQLAFVYTGERIAFVYNYYGLDTWQSPYTQLDFSFEKKIVKKISFYGKINNLTNSVSKSFLKQPYVLGNTLNRIPGQDNPSEQTIVQRDTYKAAWLLGLRFKF
jgi:hypothetical protein